MNPNAEKQSFHLMALQETDSTNRYLTGLCDDRNGAVDELTVVTAEFQTSGKGQRGNRWESAEGKNLLFSFVLYPDFVKARDQFLLSQLVSLSIKEVLDDYVGDISIKWPNDIYWRDKKLCGMLIEHNLQGMYIGRSIVGVGININQAGFVSDAPNPVSLSQITHKEEQREEIFVRIMNSVAAYYALLRRLGVEACRQELSARYARSLFRREGYHAYRDANGEFMARLLRVEDDGRFVLEDEAGRERKYLFKEVQYIL